MFNEELCALVPDSDPDWILRKLGIESRRVADPDDQVSDLAARASRRALARAGIEPDDLDGIICAVGTGDCISPATAGYVQDKIGCTNGCFAFDVKMACAGTISGIAVARGLIESGQARHVLIVGSQIMLRTSIDWTDRSTAPIFGDGAGACVVSGTTEDRGILQSRLHTDGTKAGLVGQYGGGTAEPIDEALLASKRHLLQLDGRGVWDFAVRQMPRVVREVLDAEGVDVGDVDFFVSHQANKRLLGAILDELGVPSSKTYTNVERYGNTVAASAMVALDESLERSLFTAGDLIIVMAIGGGMSWGAHLIRW